METAFEKADRMLERMQTMERWLLNSSFSGISRSGFLYGDTTKFRAGQMTFVMVFHYTVLTN